MLTLALRLRGANLPGLDIDTKTLHKKDSHTPPSLKDPAKLSDIPAIFLRRIAGNLPLVSTTCSLFLALRPATSSAAPFFLSAFIGF